MDVDIDDISTSAFDVTQIGVIINLLIVIDLLMTFFISLMDLKVERIERIERGWMKIVSIAVKI